jgi:hypothetical protein
MVGSVIWNRGVHDRRRLNSTFTRPPWGHRWHTAVATMATKACACSSDSEGNSRSTPSASRNSHTGAAQAGRRVLGRRPIRCGGPAGRRAEPWHRRRCWEPPTSSRCRGSLGRGRGRRAGDDCGCPRRLWIVGRSTGTVSQGAEHDTSDHTGDEGGKGEERAPAALTQRWGPAVSVTVEAVAGVVRHVGDPSNQDAHVARCR